MRPVNIYIYVGRDLESNIDVKSGGEQSYLPDDESGRASRCKESILFFYSNLLGASDCWEVRHRSSCITAVPTFTATTLRNAQDESRHRRADD